MEPVSAASGATSGNRSRAYVETFRDFLVPGPLPLSGARHMALGAPRPEGPIGPLGRCQGSLFDEVVVVSGPGQLAYHDAGGNEIAFERPFNFLASHNGGSPHLALRAPWLKRLSLQDGTITRHFSQHRDRIYRLVALEDQHGNRAELRRTEEGWLTRLDGPGGLSLRFENDAEGRRTAVTLVGTDGSEMPLARYAYDARSRMVSAERAAGGPVRYRWLEDRDLLASWGDPSGRSEARLTYDGEGRVVRAAWSGVNGDRFVYERARRRARHVPAGDEARAEAFAYDPQKGVSTRTDALGKVTKVAFDAAGSCTGETDPLGATTAARHDARGNLESVTDGEGRTVRYRRGEYGQILLIVDGEGHERTFEHDGPRLLLARDPLGNETRFEHDARGNVVAVLRPEGAERRVYDAHDRLTERHHAGGGVTRYGHDAFGRCASIEDARGDVMRISYEDGGAGVVTFSPRAGAGATGAEITDGAAASWRYEIGASGLVRSITGPSGARLTLAYDGEGRIEAATGAGGRVHRFERDVAGRVVAEVDFAGRRTVHARDAAGRVAETTLPDGARLRYERDRSGLLVRLAAFQPNETHPCEVLTYAYDRRGLVVEATSRASHVKLTRDGNGRVVRETRDGRAVEPVFDADVPRVERRIGERLIRDAGDPLGLLASMIDRDRPPIVIHAALGREARRSGLDGLWSEHAEGLLERLASMRRAAVAQWFPGGAADALGSLRGAFLAERREAVGPGARAADGDGFVEMASGSPGERVTLEHDACGRLVSRSVERRGEAPQVWRYTWDPLDRLAACVTPLGERRTYDYDALGRRL